MAYLVELQITAKTDTGLVRSHNEDSFAINPELGFAILADGMGGYSAGEVASGMATALLKDALDAALEPAAWNARIARGEHPQPLLVDAIERTNRIIFESGRNEPKYSGMGTTLVVTTLYQDQITIAHVGDSRAYRLRQGRLVQLTRDHSLLQEQLDAGLISPELARVAPYRNLVTRAVGVDPTVEVEAHDYLTEAGDLYMLCSDGLTDMLPDQEISECLATADVSLDTACEALITRANDHGGYDNISVVLMKIQSIDSRAESLFTRIRNWIK